MPVINSKPNLESLKKQGYTCVDMHVHTRASSDAFANINLLLKRARQHGYGLAITDHNQIASAVLAIESQKEVLIIPGIEVKPRNGIDILFYFYHLADLKKFFAQDIEPYQKNNSFINSQSTEQIIAKAKKYHCVIAAPHPFVIKDLGIGSALENGVIDKNCLADISLVEVINGTSAQHFNRASKNWAEKNNKKITGGSDAHQFFTSGTVLTCSKLKEKENFLDSIQREEALVIGKTRNFIGVSFGFIIGNLKLLFAKNGWSNFWEHMKICFSPSHDKHN